MSDLGKGCLKWKLDKNKMSTLRRKRRHLQKVTGRKNPVLIGLTDKKDYYLHHVKEEGKRHPEYKPVLGHKGAAVWEKTYAENFIKASGYDNLKTVDVIDVV